MRPLTIVFTTALVAGALSHLASARAAGPFSAHDAQARALLARMTLEEKVGQMTQADHASIRSRSEVSRLFLGSVFSGGSSDPAGGNSLAAWSAMYDAYQAEAAKTRLRIPLLYGVDAVHGHNNVLGAVVFPHNIGLGATRNPRLVEDVARVTAKEVRASGINWTFAPSVAVPRDIRWGRTFEGFSEDPAIVRELSEAAVRGYQGDELRRPNAVLACAKHYVGDGGTTFGTGMLREGSTTERYPLDQGDTRLSEQELRALHMQGYLAAIRSGVGSIMPSHSSWNGVKCAASRRLLTEILKEELGFEGFLVSDYADVELIDPDYAVSVATTINAGMDMVMAPERHQEFFDTLVALAKSGRVPMARIDDAVLRILRVKLAMGLFEDGYRPSSDPRLAAAFGSAEHRQLARQAVSESLVLLKNEKETLPLRKTLRRIHVAGKSADDLGRQCGGWTIDWPGRIGELTPGGTTVLQAIRAAVSKETTVSHSTDGTAATGADVAVVVVGEDPYVEMTGDTDDLRLAAEDAATVRRVKAAGIPVVVVLLSGRPLVLGDALRDADAWVAAWLPGTEGAGVADVLFGDYRPSGKLGFSWPRSMEQVATRDRRDPLFPVGYGLSYGSPQTRLTEAARE